MGKYIMREGDLFFSSVGEYSDYRVINVCKAIKEFNILDLKKEYLLIFPDQAREYHFQPRQFVSWLINDMALAEKLPCREFHVGNYNCIDGIEII